MCYWRGLSQCGNSVKCTVLLCYYYSPITSYIHMKIFQIGSHTWTADIWCCCICFYCCITFPHQKRKKKKNLSNSPTPRKNPNKPNNGPFGIAYELYTSACANMDFYVSSIYSLKQSQFFEFQQCATPPTITASRRKKNHAHTKETTTKVFVSLVPKFVISFVQTRNQLGLIKLQAISTQISFACCGRGS